MLRRDPYGVLKEFGISVLTYSITSNHTHLLVRAKDSESISAFMQKLEGEFAEWYNLRKKNRSGAFWGGRYWSTMVETGQYVRTCMRYVDLNMVRAGVVEHPEEWEWCGYSELVGGRQRYRLLDLGEVLDLLEYDSVEDFREEYQRGIKEAIEKRLLSREACWTESIAVGSEPFVRDVGEKTIKRVELSYEATGQSQWVVREQHAAYV